MEKNTNIKQSKNIFSTQNFALAAFLKARQCKLIAITKDDTRHATFEFEDSEELHSLVKEFWESSGLVEPKNFYNSQRELKSLLYDGSCFNNCVRRSGLTATSAWATQNKSSKVSGDTSDTE